MFPYAFMQNLIIHTFRGSPVSPSRTRTLKMGEPGGVFSGTVAEKGAFTKRGVWSWTSSTSTSTLAVDARVPSGPPAPSVARSTRLYDDRAS